MTWLWIILGFLGLVAVFDIYQKKHAILRNFPIIGHFRYILEAIGPELRQYIVTDNDEERPFTRDQRRWVYATSKKQNDYFGFGTDNDLEQTPNYIFIKHSPFPLNLPMDAPHYRIPCAKVLGAHRKRRKALRMPSAINLSAMSFGSLSSAAVEAINRGCALSGAWHNTGEGGISRHHLHGGDLVWQIGTGYFGCRNKVGGFDLERFRSVVQQYPQIRAIEIKLSQGAKAGLGGVVLGKKVTPEIAAIRGVEAGKDCLSPPAHTAFSDADSLLDFAELLAETSGLPVGIKSAVGQIPFWTQLADLMKSGTRGLDFITIDGGEGGTGAAPLVFADHVALPFKQAFSRVYLQFAEQDLHKNLVFIGSGKLGFPESALVGFALGCDAVNVGREAMLSIGCIQAQRCHTGHCPAGVATQNQWLMRGLDPNHKSARLANYIKVLRKEILRVCHASGISHPCLMDSHQVEISDGHLGLRSLEAIYGYPAHVRPGSAEWIEQVNALMTKTTKSHAA